MVIAGRLRIARAYIDHMRCFFDLNESAPHFWSYGEMLKVAVLSLQQHTPLEPILIYDGRENALTRWMDCHGVEIIRHRCLLYPELVRRAAETGNGAYLAHGPGVLIKADLPDLCAARGWADERVVFCDCDVMFQGDPTPDWPDLAGRCFAAGPEESPLLPDRFNTGVMLMDMAVMLPRAAAFRNFLAEILPEAVKISWDQHAYRLFYGTNDWLPLRAELNWKPYWGFNPSARIIHFHGPKPWMRADIAAGRVDPVHAELAGEPYRAYCEHWDTYFAESVC